MESVVTRYPPAMHGKTGGEFRLARDPELLVRPAHQGADGVDRKPELLGDPRSRETIGEGQGDVTFAR